MKLHDNRVAVRQSLERRQAELYELVLNARGIESAIGWESSGFFLLVAPEDLQQAEAELTAHDQENQSRAEGKQVSAAPPNIELVLIYWALLLFFFAAVRREALSIPWLEIGAAQVGSIRSGEWWRTITALFLHVSGSHLLSNLVFGTVFLLLLSQVLGPGVSAVAVLAAGAIGNGLNALIRPAFFTSIGASTAIFGAVGLLAALRQNWHAGRRRLSMRDWVPLAGGLMLLAILGFGGEQTDILAHVFGFVAGVAVGVLLVRLNRRWTEDKRIQVRSAWAAVGLAALAWTCAILLRS